jgi:hypothetical protein
MRLSFSLLSCLAMAIAAPASAQSLGGLTRSLSGALAREAVKSPSPPKQTQPATPSAKSPPPETQPPASSGSGSGEDGSVIIIAENMPVISSDGVRVAEVNHTSTGGTRYGPNQTFFTADPYYRLRRIYGREASVRGGAVHLKMTATQYRARNQNPD